MSCSIISDKLKTLAFGHGGSPVRITLAGTPEYSFRSFSTNA